MEKIQQSIYFSLTEANSTTNKEESLIPKGLYIWGGVGTGKTMLMDLFYTTTNTSRKRRVHFHKFMLEVHCHIHDFKRHLLNTYGRDTNINLSPDRDPIKYAAQVINKESHLLCFDEFQVTDIADAIIMTKLFNELWNNGTVLVATSNRPPQDLYLGGLNRQYFLPFIDELKHRCLVKHLNSNIDYRLQHQHSRNVYFTPLSESSTKQLRKGFESFLLSEEFAYIATYDVPVMMNRKVTVEGCERACWVTFQQLCCGNLGSSDYTAIVSHFDFIFLDGIPSLSILEHDVARRFITLIDIIYDARKVLYWTSETKPNQIFQSIKPSRLSEDGDVSLKNSFGTDHFWLTDERMGREKEQVVNQDSNTNPSTTTEKVCKKPPFDSLSITEHFTLNNNKNKDNNSEEEEVELKLLEGQLASVQELSFAFKRAASRLNEMASEPYLSSCYREFNKNNEENQNN